MLRWKYVVPRLALILLIVAFLGFGLDPLLRLALVRAGRSATGQHVDIDDVDTSVLGTQITFRGIQIADPKKPERNLVQADRVVLDFDSGALLRRKYIVDEGRLSGLRIDTQRDEAAETEAVQSGDGSWLSAGTSEWLSAFAKRYGEDVEDNLETVRVSKELARRWPEEYKQLEDRVDVLVEKFRRLKDLADGGGIRNLEDLAKLQQAVTDVDDLQRELGLLRKELDRLQGQIPKDRDALKTAKQNDERRIRELLALRNMDPESLSKYLLGDEQSGQVMQALAWIQWIRTYIVGSGDEMQPERTRGINVLFPSNKQAPDILIRSLILDGEAIVSGRAFQFEGTATDLTTQPKVLGRPAVFSLRTAGAAAIQIRAVVDRTRAVAHDRVTIACPHLPQPEQSLGDADQLAVRVAAGSARLNVVLELKGDALSGQIALTQPSLQLTPSVSQECGGEQVSNRLVQALRDVRELDVKLQLAGTLRKPTWKLHSNLGTQLAGGVNRVFQAELETRREQITARLDGYVNKYVAQLEELVAEKQQELLSKLQLNETQIAALRQRVVRAIGIPGNFGDKLPLGDLFRR